MAMSVRSSSRFDLDSSNTTSTPTISKAVQRWFETLEVRRLMALVTTDQADYHYGDVATINGSEFAPNEQVQLQVVHTEGTEGSNADPQNAPWTIETDAEGNFTATWLVNDPDAVGATYTLT